MRKLLFFLPLSLFSIEIAAISEELVWGELRTIIYIDSGDEWIVHGGSLENWEVGDEVRYIKPPMPDPDFYIMQNFCDTELKSQKAIGQSINVIWKAGPTKRS